jgi:hypothetical protein
MQNVHVVSRPKFHALSNGELVFCCKSNIIYVQETIHGSSACIQPPNSATKTQLTGKQSAPFERALNFGI